MKKCASCTKDLPDAALHCVFCGAKQPPAPAVAGGMAKTVMGAYSASDMMEHLKQQGHAPPSQPPAAAPYRPHSPSQPPPAHQPPPAAYQPPPAAYQPPAPARPAHAPAPAAPPLAPAAPANAKTMFAGGPPPGAYGGGPAPGPAPGGPAPAGAFAPGGGMAPPAPPGGFGGGGPMSHPVGTSPSHASSVPLAAPSPPAPIAPVPSAAPPYGASAPPRAGIPIEPWKDSLRLMMFIWGGALIVAFVTPLSIDPLRFQWDLIADAEGVQKLPPLIMAAVGVLSLAIAGIPMSPLPRGLIAALIGLAGVLVPMFLGGVPPWQSLLQVGGLIILIPSLLVRQEYRDSIVPRILVTVGAIATLVPLLIPQNGSLPLVEYFKAVIDAPGTAKLLIILLLVQVAIVVLSLLAWMPAPSSGGAQVFAWLLVLSPVAIYFAFLILVGFIGFIPDSPALADAWVWGSAATAAAGEGKEAAAAIPTGFGFGVAYAALIGYGLATVVGKKLE